MTDRLEAGRRGSCQNTSSQTDYLLIVRARSLETNGTSYLYKDNLYQRFIPVGGTDFAVNSSTAVRSLARSSGDHLRTVFVPGGSVEHMSISFSDAAGLQIRDLDISGGIGGASRLVTSSQDVLVVFATPYVRINGIIRPYRSGLARALVNDTFFDSDGDGVGNTLEYILTTCGSPSCTDAYHGRDTDHNGLSDGEELWGLPGTSGTGLDDVPLSRWGALPLHKDAFLEIDFLTDLSTTTYPGTLSPGENPFQWMRDNPTQAITNLDAGKGPEMPATPEDFLSRVAHPFTEGPAHHLRNPDGLPGISVHFDVGVAPVNPADEYLFGDYSSDAENSIVEDFIVRFDGPIVGVVKVRINGILATWDATTFNNLQNTFAFYNAVQSLNQPVMFKSSRYVGDSVEMTFESTQPTLHFSRGIEVPPGQQGSVAHLREPDSSLRAHYTEPDFVDPVRRGVMHYGVIAYGGQAATDLPAFNVKFSSTTLTHEFGHTFRLNHHGHDDWGHPPVACISYYDSVMTYGGDKPAGQPLRLSTVEDVLTFNPARTAETHSFGSTYDQSKFASPPFFYLQPQATTSTTDFTRDQSISPSYVRWRTMALGNQNGSCKLFGIGVDLIEPGQDVTGPVDLVRHGNNLRLFWPTTGGLMMRSTPLGPKGNKSCTGSADPHPPSSGAPADCFPGMTTTTQLRPPPYYSPISGVSSLAVDGSTHDSLYVAYTDDVGYILIHQYQTPTQGGSLTEVGTGWALLPTGNNRSAGAPELVRLHDNTNNGAIALLYLSLDGEFRHYILNSAGTNWTDAGPLLDPQGMPIEGAQDPVAKAWPDATVNWWNSEKRTVALLPDDARRIDGYILNRTSGRWEKAFNSVSVSTRKPFLEFRHLRTTSGQPTTDFRGHFVFGQHRGAKGSPFAYFSKLHHRYLPPTVGNFSAGEAREYLHDSGAEIPEPGAVSMYTDSTIDNLFTLVPAEAGVAFYPHSDGSPDTQFSIYSDFRIIEETACLALDNLRIGPALGCKDQSVTD